jgi:hypothetical protein
VAKPARRRCRYRWVSDFLRPDGTWNEERVQYFFDPEDAAEILRIQTSRRHENDFVAWYPEKRGIFTVSSAYMLAFDMANCDQNWGASSGRPDGVRPQWKIVWNSPVPPKVKMLTWRICHNALSTQQNMARRKMATTVLCQICGQEAEDTYHVFMRFPHARSLWLAMKEVWELPSDELMKQQELNGSSSYSLASRRTSGCTP